jgi:Tfp pilus assembly protein PilO
MQFKEDGYRHQEESSEFRKEAIMKKNYFLFTMVLVFGLVIYLYYTFVYVEQPRKIRKLKGEIEVLNERLISAQIIARELDQVAKLIEQNLATSAKDSLAEDSSIPFLNYITNIMEELNIKLIKLDPGSKINMRDYIKSPYKMQIECTYEELGKFINRVEKSERLVTVEGFEIDNSIRKIKDIKDVRTKKNAHRMDLTISTLTLIKR